MEQKQYKEAREAVAVAAKKMKDKEDLRHEAEARAAAATKV